VLAVGVDEGVVVHANVVFGVSAAPLFPDALEVPLAPNAVEPVPEPAFEPKGEGEAPCVPLPKPLNGDLTAVSFDWGALSPPKEPKGEADEGFVLNTDGLFC